jgi:hypothetical protein
MKNRKNKLLRAAGKAPKLIQYIAGSKAARPKVRGTFGPASGVRRIDPKEYEGKY